MSSTADTRLIWIDLEMTGLDTDNDQIIEVATIVTDDNLNILAEGPVLAVHQPDRVLNAMDEWNTRQHGQSGLIERVRRSKLTAQDAEQQTLEFLKKWVNPKAHQCVAIQSAKTAVFYTV
jgi:oligoribonuclease